mgnify:FL=1|tara:strand:- start:1143 stop:1322 length:180 start_codon:yes stop_codon:yes gene_type:complete
MAGLELARKERKQVLREEAQERQAHYNELVSTETGIREVMETCGAKQRAKLLKLLNKKK